MTDTRKKIIELIEPYMDKTLEIQLKTNQIGRYNGEIYERTGNKVLIRQMYGEFLGHYDITAVLKYIKNASKCPYNYEYGIDIAGEVTDDIISIYKHERNKDGKYYGEHFSEIPNKPLHLYTEEEEKSLLELLQKLGQNTKN